MEIEIRAQLKNGLDIIKKIKKMEGIVYNGLKTEKDIYFKHKSDNERKLVLRIRQTGDKKLLTFKAKSKKHDTAWPDIDLPLHDSKTLRSILLSSDFEEVVKITKTRNSFKYGEYEINIDEIKELGSFIEIEARGNSKQRNIIETNILSLLVNLGIPKTSIILKGYVPLAIEAKNNRI